MEPGDVRLYIDEDVPAALTPALTELGYDVQSAHTEELWGMSDDQVWEYFIEHERVLVTHNVRDFEPRHREWLERGLEHPGILFGPQFGAAIGPLIASVSDLLSRTDTEDLRNNYLWFSR